MPYDWIKALHVISIVSWMAGMLYLPRLFVYHAKAKTGSELSETLKVMERRLLRFIMNPAMVASFIFGIWMLMLNPDLLHQPYMNMKFALVIFMVGIHGVLSRCRRDFESDQNRHTARYFRILNEVPTLLMIGIIILVIVRPAFS